jgi:hypothetical protein
VNISATMRDDAVRAANKYIEACHAQARRFQKGGRVGRVRLQPGQSATGGSLTPHAESETSSGGREASGGSDGGAGSTSSVSATHNDSVNHAVQHLLAHARRRSLELVGGGNGTGTPGGTSTPPPNPGSMSIPESPLESPHSSPAASPRSAQAVTPDQKPTRRRSSGAKAMAMPPAEASSTSSTSTPPTGSQAPVQAPVPARRASASLGLAPLPLVDCEAGAGGFPGASMGPRRGSMNPTVEPLAESGAGPLPPAFEAAITPGHNSSTNSSTSSQVLGSSDKGFGGTATLPSIEAGASGEGSAGSGSRSSSLRSSDGPPPPLLKQGSHSGSKGSFMNTYVNTQVGGLGAPTTGTGTGTASSSSTDGAASTDAPRRAELAKQGPKIFETAYREVRPAWGVPAVLCM